MANELAHVTVGATMTQAEFELITLHKFDSQATGDILYASSGTQLSRLAAGTQGYPLVMGASIPQWGGAITLNGAIAGGDQGWTGVGDMTFTAGSILATGGTNGNTLLLKAGGLTGTTFITLTAGATDTMALGAFTLSGAIAGGDQRVTAILPEGTWVAYGSHIYQTFNFAGYAISMQARDDGSTARREIWKVTNATDPYLVLCANKLYCYYSGAFIFADAATIEMGDVAVLRTGTAVDDLYHLQAYRTHANNLDYVSAIQIKNTGVEDDTALMGFYGATPVNQPATIADAAGCAGDADDKVNLVIDLLQELGLMA